MLAPTPAKAAPELEIKFQLGAGAVEALQGEVFPLDQATTSRLHAVYFDTASHALRDGGFSLRVRRRGDTHVQTLKHRGAGGLFERDEWETTVPGPEVDRSALAETPATEVIAQAELVPAFTVDVERRTHIWTRDDVRIEVVFDRGLIVAGDRNEPVSEIELELLSGPQEALFALARELHARAELALLFESKAERGYRLLGHDGISAITTRNGVMDRTTKGADAFQAIAREGLVQIAGNARLLQRAHNPDVLHQLRVGLRRLRAAVSLFAAMLDVEGLEKARAESRWLAGELAEARDIDVFLQRAQAPDEIDETPGRAAFFRGLRIAQAEAYERALAAVRSDRFRSMLLLLAEWIEVGAWRRLPDPAQAFREGPAVSFAAPIMGRLDRRLRRRSQKFMQLDVDARHDLRKQAKKLRYAVAFFGEAFPEHPRRRQRLLTALRKLQDLLGELNDVAVARTVAMRAVGRRSAELAFAAGLEVGRITRDEDAVLHAANDAFKAYRRVKRFWDYPLERNEELNLSQSSLRSV